MPFWRQAVRQLFGWRNAAPGRMYGARWYRNFYLYIPRKNSKTTFLAGLILAIPMIEPEQGGQIWIAASTEEQAGILFDFAKKFVEGSPDLLLIYRVGAEELEHVETRTRIRFMSGAPKGKVGTGPSVLIIDEYQEQPNYKLLNKLRTGTGARKAPLTIICGTAGGEDESEDVPWITELKKARAVKEAADPASRYLPMIFEASEDDDPGDPATWFKANPGLDYCIYLDTFAGIWEDMKDDPTSRRDFLQYHLNIVQKLASELIPMEKWIELQRTYTAQSLHGKLAYGGLDLGHTSDMTAFSLLFPTWKPVKYKDDDGRWQTKMHATFKVLVWYFSPKQAIELSKKTTVSYEPWVKEKWVEVTGDRVADYEMIRTKIQAICKKYKVVSIGFDPWHADEMTKKLAGKKLLMVEVLQTFRNLSRPTERFTELVLSGDIEHNGNPVLIQNLRNVRVLEDKQKHRMCAKKSSKGKIDGLAATINALRVFMDAPPPPPPLRVTSV